MPPYTDHGADQNTLNANDGIASRATRASFAYVKELATSCLVAMIIGVDPIATSTAGQMPDGAGQPPNGSPPDGSAPPAADAVGSPGATSTDTAISLVPGVSGIR